jgi:hypothetical protein
MSLEKIMAEPLNRREDSNDIGQVSKKNDIGQVSKKIENQKFVLANKIKTRGFYLNVVNFAMIQEYQIYALVLQLLDRKEDEKTIKEILDDFTESAIGTLKINIKELADDVVKLQKDQAEEKDNDE